MIAQIAVFNVQDLIYSCLSSIAPAVDEIRIYDSRFPDFKCEVCGKDHDNSCDRTQNEIERFSSESIVRLWTAMPELQKRTRMLQDVPEGTMTLTIDDDEILAGNPEPVKSFNESVGYIDFLFAEAGPGTGKMIPLARLIKTTPGIHYKTVFRIMDDKGLVVDMREDNKMVPYGRRAPGRNYLPPTTFMVELANFRSRKRSLAELNYNKLANQQIWQ